MKNITMLATRIVLTLALVSQTAGPGWADFNAGMNGGGSPEAMGVTSNAMPTAATVQTSQTASLIMGGIKLPTHSMTMDFQDADIKDVLHLMALKSGFNIIYGADIAGPITIHLDRVPFDQAFQTILTLKALVALPMGPKVIRVVTSTTLNSEQSQAATFTRVFNLNYAAAEDVKRPIDAIRSSANRKGVSTVDTKTNAIIITDTIEGLKEVEDLIPVLDRKPQQVDIESKIVEVTLDNSSETGISWAYAGSVGKEDKYKIGGSQLTDTSSSGGPGVVGGPSTIVTPLGPADLYTSNSGVGTRGTGVTLNNIATGVAPIGFSFLTQQGTYLLSAQISALASKGRAKVLSTPHIVTTNNQEASINVTDQIPYTVTTVSGSGLATTSVQFISAGVKLTVKPTVNADRRITLKVKPEVSNPRGTGSATLPPTVNTRNADTTVLLRDGETIAIGGLIREQEDKTVTGIPFLMSIPILGYLFKTVANRKSRTELIVFITPKIAAE